MGQFHIPRDVEVRGMLGMLYDGLTVDAGASVSGNEAGHMIGTYIDDDDKLVALCVCDAELSAFSSSSLTMIPKGGAEDAAKNKQLEPGMLDNLGEVMNILSRLFMREGTPHLRYDKIYAANDLPDDIKDFISGSQDKIDFKLNIPGYGAGNLSMVTC